LREKFLGVEEAELFSSPRKYGKELVWIQIKRPGNYYWEEHIDSEERYNL